MGGIGKVLGKVVQDANVNPEIKLALQHYPNELLARELGRTLTPFESDALGRELLHRGILQNMQKITEQHLVAGKLLKELQEKQNSTGIEIINNIK